MGPLPFEGLRVIDFGWIYAVPYATAWLGALGAEVIRIESSLAPDVVRLVSGTDGVSGINRSGRFNSINFSRKSLALNLATSEGREIARRLVKLSDFVTENYGVGNMKKFGLAYEDIVQVKPDIIMLSGTPLGQTGPYAKTVGYGPTTQAFAGICHLTGYPGGFPCGIGGTWPDFAVGTAMVFFLLSALHYRDATGEGQFLDISMAETVTSMIPEAIMDYFLNWRDSGPVGNRDDAMAPHGVFPVKGDDRWVALAIATDAEFASLCEVLEVPKLAHQPEFARLALRLKNVDELERQIATRTREFERDDLVGRLRQRDLAAAPVNTTEDLLADQAFLESGMLHELDHAESGKRIVPGLPVSFSEIEPRYTAAPALGQHSEEVLSTLLGLSAAEINRLRECKVII